MNKQIILRELVFLTRDLLLKFATENLTDNHDLYIWLGMLEASSPESVAPYDFLRDKIPNFEEKFLKEVNNTLKTVYGKHTT